MWNKQNRIRGWAVVVCLAVLTTLAAAQLPVPAASQFDIDGFIQDAKLDGNGAGALQGGHITVNGHVVVVPSNTIVILPANALTWAELFSLAPAPYAGVATGMALDDSPTPLATYEAHVIGNRVGDTYIAGLIFISQQDLNSGAGFINFIDYANGEMRVGGVIGDSTSGTRIRINDPVGRFGRVATPDGRFTVDADNPTIASATGFPMCFPRVTADPTVAGNPDDPLCPQGNRPLLAAGGFAPSFKMPDAAGLALGQLPDPRIQVPFEVGDWVTYAGTLVQDCSITGCPNGGPTTGPWPAAGNSATYVAAHTITNNIAVYTADGKNPAYVSIDVFIIGTGGLTVLGAGEATIRTRFEGMASDTTRVVHLYGMDLSPDGKTETDRDWGLVGIDPGPPKGAVAGRWRFRPPCTGTPTTISDKLCSPPAGGSFLPPTREVRAVIEGMPGTTQVPAWVAGQTTTYANGLIAGQYHAPILEYLFPENVPGAVVVPNNFEAIPFLAQGGYASSTGVVAGQLNPWPGASAPAPVGPVAPVASASSSASTVASGGTITLNASASGTTPITYAWTQTAGTAGTFPAGQSGASVSWTAPIVAASESATFQVTATNSAGSSNASVSVTVNAAGVPTVLYTPASPITVGSGTPVSLTASCTDPQNLPCTFLWTQTNAGAVGVQTVLNPNPNPNAGISFTVTLPLGTTSPMVIQLQVVATDSAGLQSAPEFTSVTINPLADSLTTTLAEYRISKQRLTLNVTDSIISPNITLTLQPYMIQCSTLVVTAGVPSGCPIYNPAPSAGGVGNVFVNNNGGLYTLDMVGAPEPACGNPANTTPCPALPLTTTSNIGGATPPSSLTRIRN